jgi:hypothetical protein
MGEPEPSAAPHMPPSGKFDTSASCSRVGAVSPPSSLAWTSTALVGFVAIIAGTLHFARRGLDPAGDRLIARDAAGAGALVAVGLALFFLGLYKA